MERVFPEGEIKASDIAVGKDGVLGDRVVEGIGMASDSAEDRHLRDLAPVRTVSPKTVSSKVGIRQVLAGEISVMEIIAAEIDAAEVMSLIAGGGVELGGGNTAGDGSEQKSRMGEVGPLDLGTGEICVGENRGRRRRHCEDLVPRD